MGSEVQILPGPYSDSSSGLGPWPWHRCPLGGVAQLGEHLLCKQGVVGSSPITSISGEGERKVENCDGASFRSADGLRAVAFPRTRGLFFVRVNQVLVRFWALGWRDLTGGFDERPLCRCPTMRSEA